jgi:hypothetical protein
MMKKRLKVAMMAAIAAIALLTAACFRHPATATDYFPFKQGVTWTFRFSASTGTTGELKITNLAPSKLYGYTVVAQENTGAARSYREYYTDDGAGIRHVAIETAQGLRSRIEDHAYVVKNPIRIGTAWREVERTLDGTMFDAKTVIESTSDRVSVPAGTFSGCVRVRSTGTASPVKHAGDAGRAAEDAIEVEDYYWLAPGVGPVKGTHQEVSGEGETAQSIGISLELEQVQK